jgi:peptidoglycan L-alanyl-D-glutamate endopeptidase CwlK
MMGFKLGKTSLDRLQGVDETLVNVVKRAIEISEVDFTVLEGVRTLERQRELYAQGRTAPGKIVTWTMKSRHIEGKAVDLVPYPLDWNDLDKFNKIKDAMFQAAKELDVNLRWGADWDGDGNYREKGEYDSPHFEIN